MRREPAQEPPSAEQLLPRGRRGEVRHLLTQEAPGTGGQRPPGPTGAEQGSGPHAVGVQKALRSGRRRFLCVGLSPRVFPEAASDRSPRSSSPTPARGLLGPQHRPLRNPVPTPSLALPGPRARRAVGLAVRAVGMQEWGAASAARRGRAHRRVGASTLALSVYTRANHRPEPAVHRQHGRTSFPGQESGRILGLLGLSRPWHLHVLRPGTLTPSPALA